MPLITSATQPGYMPFFLSFWAVAATGGRVRLHLCGAEKGNDRITQCSMVHKAPTRQLHSNPIAVTIATSYQKLPFGSGGLPR